jgi:transposase
MQPEVTDKNGKKQGGGLNGPKYVEQVLCGPLVEFVADMKERKGDGITIVEDGASPHHSVIAKKAWSKLGIELLTHPPSSPNLNLIVPLWLKLKNCVADIPGSHSSLDKLWAACQKVWDELSVEDITAHTSKIPKGVAEVEGSERMAYKLLAAYIYCMSLTQ